MNTKLVDNTVAYMQAKTRPSNREFVKLFAKVLETFQRKINEKQLRKGSAEFDTSMDWNWLLALKQNGVFDNDDELRMILNTELDAFGAFPGPNVVEEVESDEAVEPTLAELCVSYASRYYLKNGSAFVEAFADAAVSQIIFAFTLRAAMTAFAGKRIWEEVYNTKTLQYDLLWR